MKITRGTTSLGTGLLLTAALVPGLACNGPASSGPEQNNEFGVLLEGLGDDIASCTAGDISSGDLTLSLADGEDAVISVVSNVLTVNGFACVDNATGDEITAQDAGSLTVSVADAATSKVVIDLLPGSFGQLVGNSGGITVDIGAGATVDFGVRGTEAANNFKMMQDDNDLFAEISGNTVADVKITGDAPNSVTFALGDGNDTFNAQDTTNLTAAHLGTTGSMVAVADNVTVYGGGGNDTLEGGSGDDTLDGGDGNDTFTTFTGDDGADTYIGGAGTDTISYADRTNAVTVDIDPGTTNRYVEGNVLHGVAVTTNTLVVEVGGVAETTITFSNENTVTTILAAINGVLAASTASVNDRGELVITADAADTNIAITTDGEGLFPSLLSETDNNDDDDGESGEADDVRSDVENITGGSGNDRLTGSTSSNTIIGGAGDDNLSGGPGGTDCTADADTLTGGDGDDTFEMGLGLNVGAGAANCGDSVDGGNHTNGDKVDYQMRTAALTIALNNSADDGITSEGDNVRTGMEIIVGGEAGDTITGSTSADTIFAGLGGDTINGGNGDDVIHGGPGADTINGDAGDDTINEVDDETAASNVAAFRRASLDTITSFGGLDTIHGGTGTNVCDYSRTADASTFNLCYSSTSTNCATPGASGPESDLLTNCTHLITGSGNNTINGSDDDDIIEAGDGNDTVNAGTGNDIVYGEGGDDILNGDGGEDTLDAGGQTAGNTLDGGDGQDVCVHDGQVNDAVSNCEI